MKNLINIDPKDAEMFGKQIVAIQHSLKETGLFSKDSLASLIEKVGAMPERHYILGAPHESGEVGHWQNGSFDNISGKDMLKAVEKGRMWLQIQDLDLVAPDQWAVAEQVFAELEEKVPGFSYTKLRANILISSPTMRVLTHSDCAEVVLLHIQGRKRLTLFDGDNEEYLPREILEGIILKETEEEIPYKPEWDKDAYAFDIEPGQAMSWPQFWPHKVDNISGLNISLQCEYFSNEARRRYGVNFANGLMRRRAGVIPSSFDHNGAGALMKCGIAVMAKKLGVHKAMQRKLVESFVVDLNAPDCKRMVAQAEQKIIAK